MDLSLRIEISEEGLRVSVVGFEMSELVKIVECPRDAWQGLKGQIPADVKVQYLRALIRTGFKHIDAVSFVSPKAVPQMADSEEVLEKLDPPDDVEIIGIVVNQKGAERAIATEAVRTLGFVYSVSPTFLERNQNQALEAAIDEAEQIKLKADKAGLDMVVYISMAFGNPYGDLWSPEEVVEAVGILADMGIGQISLADTVGVATPQQVKELVAAVTGAYDHLEIGAHLHSTPTGAAEKVVTAYDAGCRRFDSAIGGLGGCPFAQDAMIGNIPTEIAVKALAEHGANVPLKKSLDEVIQMSTEIAKKHTVVM
ncbi:MAG TPA: hydroxymethylglutaryl-CoA lyase [Candidatus Angelobacter sp.]|nr:hydroxymethylglutaryl-CoA lyase [Candidatus Angelobacter sp.]